MVDLSIRVSMGALCALKGTADTLQVSRKPSDARAGGLSFSDGVRKIPVNPAASFRYMTTPLPRQLNPPVAAGTSYPEREQQEHGDKIQNRRMANCRSAETDM